MLIRIAGLTLTLGAAAAAQTLPLDVASPDGRVVFRLIETDEALLAYEVHFAGKPLLAASRLGLDPQNQAPLGSQLTLQSALHGQVDECYSMKHGKANPLRARANTLTAMFQEQVGLRRQLGLEVRVFDDGLGFRYHVPQQAALRELRLARELTQFHLAREGPSYPLLLNGYRTSYEDSYVQLPVTSIKPAWLVGLPYLANVPGVAWVAITESHLENYSGLYLKRPTGRILEASLAPRVDDPSLAVIRATPLETPWRVLLISDRPGALVESNIVLHLAPTSRISDDSWIQPGKTSWSWWSGDYATGVPFKPGMNTETMKHYIDFSAENGIEYMMLDEGWSADVDGRSRDLTKTNPQLDLPALLDFARERKVGLWLWAHWTFVDMQMDEAFPLFEKWGIRGVKIDFMDRDDQDMVAFYHRVMRKAAEHRLMVDFHGAYKPCGLRRYYPNLLTREAAMSLEYVKWSNRVTAEHNVTLAFTRMLAGPLDYTPGGFSNVRPAEFTPRWLNSQVPTTRAHQTALYIIIESAFTMFADFPGAYAGQPETPFLREVPVTWDETRVLAGEPVSHIVIARRKGANWYIGGITNGHARELPVKFDFLGAGAFTAEIIMDSGSGPARTRIVRQAVTRASETSIRMEPAGGFVITVKPARR
jgi:alpha-glucosidase